MKPKLVDKLTAMDREHLPVFRLARYISNGEAPPVLTEKHVISDRQGNILCECDDKDTADYIVQTMNMTHFSKKTQLAREELKDEVIGTIVIKGEVIPKDDKHYPYMDTSSVVRYRRNADYRCYVGKFRKTAAQLWTLRDDQPIDDAEVYLVILFYVSSAYNRNIGDCISTVVDGLIDGNVVKASRRARVSGIAKTAFVRCKDNHRTEVYLMRYGK